MAPSPASPARAADEIDATPTSGVGRATDDTPPRRGSAKSASSERQVAAYLRRLRSKESAVAEAAFRELWEVPKRLIPALLRHTEDRSPTSMTRLQVIVFGNVAQADPTTDEWVYYVPGLAGVKVDDLATGKTRRPGAFKVVLKRHSGFPVGVVVRAALLNRFRSPDYATGDGRTDPGGWWYKYYRNVRGKL